VNFPEVELIVDGDKWIDERDNPEIIDDWPLHPAADITTKITIGACWQGQSKRNLLQNFLFRSMSQLQKYNLKLSQLAFLTKQICEEVRFKDVMGYL
jgi:hypothetical protein